MTGHHQNLGFTMRQAIGTRLVAAVVLGLSTVGMPTAPSDARQLLSIKDFQLAENQAVEGISVTLRNATIIALCRLPPGWDIEVGNRFSPGSHLRGGANYGAAMLTRDHTGELRDLVLIDDGDGALSAAGFTGDVSLRTYGTGEADATKLQPSNFVLRPAAHCP